MKRILTLLIEDDIKITRLVRTLAKLDIDANSYLTHKSTIVFEMVEIKHSINGEELMNQYYDKIEQASDKDQTGDKQAIEGIINWFSAIE